MINISYLQVPQGDNTKLKDAMYYTAKDLYRNITIDFKKLHYIVKSDFRQYSPFIFNNNTKISENWINEFQQLLILDVDDGLSILEAKERFKRYKYLICTTKSHQKLKKGIKCDRFRVILEAINIPKGDKYFDYIRNLEILYPFIDKQVNTKTGAFLGCSDCEYWYNDGILFDFEILKPIKICKPIEMPKQNFDNEDLELNKVKSLLNAERVRDILISLGYEVDRNFKFKYRDSERTPSASIRHDGHIKDFGSDLSTDAIGFVQIVKNIGFKESLDYVKLYV